MPLHRDENGGGTEADGSLSNRFCSRCYTSGKFTQPDITVVQMQELVREKMVSMGFPRFLTGLFTRKIPRLERWRPAG